MMAARCSQVVIELIVVARRIRKRFKSLVSQSTSRLHPDCWDRAAYSFQILPRRLMLAVTIYWGSNARRFEVSATWIKSGFFQSLR